MSDTREPSPGATHEGSAPVSVELIQEKLARAAFLNMYSVPTAGRGAAAITSGSASRPIGYRIDETLHRFDVTTEASTETRPFVSRNLVGERVGRFTHRWLLAPDDFVATPGREPPPTALDPSRSQRFVMLDSRCTFGDGADGYRGFGVGHTVPASSGGRDRVLVNGVGAILEGSGWFARHEQGTYVYCGSLDPESGFTGNLLLRLMGGDDGVSIRGEVPAAGQGPEPEPGVTYALLRGQAVPSDPVSPYLGPDGRPIGLTIEQGVRRVEVGFAFDGRRGLVSSVRVGPLVGGITAHVKFNPASAAGTVEDPIPFGADDHFVFADPEGGPVHGTLHADSNEGRVFNTKVGGQPAIRFGGIGRILGGTGVFQGIRGLMTNNSGVVFEPHLSAGVYLFRIEDPDGRYRAGDAEGCCGGSR